MIINWLACVGGTGGPDDKNRVIAHKMMRDRGLKMAMSAQLRLRQTHSLALTPRLIQSIRLLQMTAVELDRFIDAELESNPLLERAQAELGPEGFFSASGVDEAGKSRQANENSVAVAEDGFDAHDYEGETL